MPEQEADRAKRFEERYATGEVPWDHSDPPPEVMEFVAKHPPGRALDLGCGYGRAAIHLAERNWTVDGVDFVDAAIDEARARAEAAGVTDRIHFHVGSTTELGRLPLAGPYDLVLDVGCCHRMNGEALTAHRDGFVRLLEPGGWFLLFANLWDPATRQDGDEPQWIKEGLLLSVLGESLDLDHAEHGTTEVPDRPDRQSAWFWFRRPEAA